MENISERLDVINTSFFQDLMSVKTTFESKVRRDPTNVSLFTILLVVGAFQKVMDL